MTPPPPEAGWFCPVCEWRFQASAAVGGEVVTSEGEAPGDLDLGDDLGEVWARLCRTQCPTGEGWHGFCRPSCGHTAHTHCLMKHVLWERFDRWWPRCPECGDEFGSEASLYRHIGTTMGPASPSWRTTSLDPRCPEALSGFFDRLTVRIRVEIASSEGSEDEAAETGHPEAAASASTSLSSPEVKPLPDGSGGGSGDSRTEAASIGMGDFSAGSEYLQHRARSKTAQDLADEYAQRQECIGPLLPAALLPAAMQDTPGEADVPGADAFAAPRSDDPTVTLPDAGVARLEAVAAAHRSASEAGRRSPQLPAWAAKKPEQGMLE